MKDVQLSDAQRQVLAAISKEMADEQGWVWSPFRRNTLLALRDRGLVELKTSESYAYSRTRVGFGTKRGARVYYGHDLGVRLTPDGIALLGTRSNPAVEPARGYSEGTSLAQVPALHRLVMKHGWWDRGNMNADIGGGKYDLASEFLAAHGVKNYVYDPGNRSRAHNDRVLRKIEDGRADTATIANVLNVIPDVKVRQQVLNLARNAVRPGGMVFISIYEGDGTGRGRETSKGWQANRKTKAFLTEVQRVFPRAVVKHGIILAEA